jgi:hypothetical protein
VQEAWVNGGSNAGEADTDNGKGKGKRASSSSPGPESSREQKPDDSSNRGDVGYDGPPRMRATSNPTRVRSPILAINRERAGSKAEGK